MSLSSGLIDRRFITSALIPSFESNSAACNQEKYSIQNLLKQKYNCKGTTKKNCARTKSFQTEDQKIPQR